MVTNDDIQDLELINVCIDTYVQALFTMRMHFGVCIIA